MNSFVLSDNLSILQKQRNLFLLIALFLLASNMLLVIFIHNIDKKVILVPGIRSEMTISDSGISKSYLEEMSLLFISNLLDLTPSDIGHKKDLIMKYTAGDKLATQALLNYFQTAARDYTKFGLSTFFTTKHLDIDLPNLTVIASGILTSYYGKSGHNIEQEDYKLEFVYQGGNLRLKSFKRMMSDAKKAKIRTKSEKLEQAITKNLNPSLSQKDIKSLQKTEVFRDEQTDNQSNILGENDVSKETESIDLQELPHVSTKGITTLHQIGDDNDKPE
ncbi:MAG: TraE/TraK family type IV conjugative transfer system protein [Rickettsiaceae bacterium]|nr:TraE/TraK family type IV conjugative transfer system protein [Rickettsiaceae bacterium]